MSSIDYLDRVAASAPGRIYKRQLLAMLDVHPGHAVLDIGCGPGTDLGELANAVGPTGSVIGVDHDLVSAETARERLAVHRIVDVRVGDAHALPLEEGSVDRARTDRVLQHVADPRRVLSEIRRVARPGARIALAEPDWDGLLVDSANLAAGRTLTNFITSQVVRNATIGRALPRLCAEAGFSVTSVVASAPVITDFEAADQLLGLRRNARRCLGAMAEDWLAELAAGPFLASCLIFLVVATV
ncbi:methyltransferase domain-containing protein [Nonomuraea sp. NPDC050536]|uniref:methyltransferase domain-containing protein n=1 Tax=Nonomuraea sp. NPDC050536 TaxID=3364366 RepID=UPI0037C80B14